MHISNFSSLYVLCYELQVFAVLSFQFEDFLYWSTVKWLQHKKFYNHQSIKQVFSTNTDTKMYRKILRFISEKYYYAFPEKINHHSKNLFLRKRENPSVFQRRKAFIFSIVLRRSVQVFFFPSATQPAFTCSNSRT